MKKTLVMLSAAALLFFSGCGESSTGDESSFMAEVLDLTDGGALVEPLAEEEILKSADWIYFGTKELDTIGAETGDVISVVYTGDIAETYPAQIRAVSWRIVEKAADAQQEEENKNIPAEESTVSKRDLEVIKEHLSTYSNDYEGLKKAECYMVVHGQEDHGQELWEDFYQSVQDGQSAELDLVQFTVEGDPIIYHLDYNGADFYLVNDFSRDAFGGTGEKYWEDTFPYLKVFEETKENGDKIRKILLTDSESLTYRQIKESWDSHTELEGIRVYYVAELVLGNTRAEINGKDAVQINGTIYDCSMNGTSTELLLRLDLCF